MRSCRNMKPYHGMSIEVLMSAKPGKEERLLDTLLLGETVVVTYQERTRELIESHATSQDSPIAQPSAKS